MANNDSPNDTANTRTQTKNSFQVESIDFKNLLIISSAYARSRQIGTVPQCVPQQERKGPRCARAAQAFFFFFLLLSVGSYVPAPPPQPSCGRLRSGCIAFGAALISSHNSPTACPSGCPGSVGYSYAMLRQQAKNMVGEREAGTPGSRPARAKRSITS
jgi:hypothetical protein